MLRIFIFFQNYSISEPNCPQEQGYCVSANGDFPNAGLKKLNSLNGNSLEMQEECLELCRAVPGVTGCQVIWDQGNRGCYAHTGEVARGNGADKHLCWNFANCN